MNGSHYAIIIVLAAVLFVALFFWVIRDGVEKDIAVAVITASATVFASVIVVSITQHSTTSSEIAESHRLNKVEVYIGFSDLVFDIFQMIKISGRQDLSKEEKEGLVAEAQRDLEAQFSSFNRKLLLWGSPEVIHAWLKFRENSRLAESQGTSSASPNASLELLLYMDDVFRVMRRDLELSNRDLEEGDLVKSFLTDPEILDPVIGKRRR